MKTTTLSTEKIIEETKLIAEFMKNEAVNSPHLKNTIELEYHQNWSWLMPVVEKIESCKTDLYEEFAFRMQRKHCCIFCRGNGQTEGVVYQTPYGFVPETKIEAVWLAVVEFIKWYNEQKK